MLLNLSGRFARDHRPPQRRGAGLRRIAVPQRQVQLVGIEADAARGVRLRPVPKAALRESFLAEPETLAVVGQKLDRVPTP